MSDSIEDFLESWSPSAPARTPPPVGAPGCDLGHFLDCYPPEQSKPVEASNIEASGDIQALLQLAEPLEAAANSSGIFNVFDDGGFRTLLRVTLFGLRTATGKLGDDAVDASGRRYELKTVNLINSAGETRKASGVTTEHSMRQANIDRYRKTDEWLIGVFNGNRPIEVWQVPSLSLEPVYCKWEQAIQATPGGQLNNPKIPMALVRRLGRHHKIG